MDMMKEFKAGKIVVFTNSIDEAKMFLKECEEEDIKWSSGERATGMGDWFYKQFDERRGIVISAYSGRKRMVQGTEAEVVSSSYGHLMFVDYLNGSRFTRYLIEKPV